MGDMQGAKVLVVDDSTSVRKVLERLLAGKGMQVMSAESAEQGLELVNRSQPNLIIADVVMPGMSGFELCQLLKLNARTEGLPVILISGIINDGVMAQAKEAGAVAVVSKPFTPDDLFPKVERALATQVALVGAPVPASSPEPVPPPPPPIPSDRLANELRPFLDKPEVESVLVMSSEGRLLATAGSPVEEVETFAAYLRTLLSISRVLGDKHGFSPLQSLSLEYLGKTVLVNHISEGSVLALVVRGSGGSGVIRYLVLKQMPQLKAILEG
ncbi:transcriptional regulator [Meiothermus granaticius NBRC 107808]|nr:transcriptional regulator [Meiothermus granaticius NBRC 107808]